jgi:hypothetical protein
MVEVAVVEGVVIAAFAVVMRIAPRQGRVPHDDDYSSGFLVPLWSGITHFYYALLLRYGVVHTVARPYSTASALGSQRIAV